LVSRILAVVCIPASASLYGSQKQYDTSLILSPAYFQRGQTFNLKESPFEMEVRRVEDTEE
jgi:hypothetical protein